MFITVAHSLIVVQSRRLVQLFPDPLQKLWNYWELRVMVLFSLAFQVSMILYGNRRRYDPRYQTRIFLWCAYLLADSVATVALGVLSNDQGHSCTCEKKRNNHDEEAIAAFWAPFLLLHLGGPDTITAYSLEDNELWLRHLLGLVVQTSVAIYIILTAWTSSLISYLTLPMLVAGIVKYGERTWVLRFANSDHFRDSLLTDPDPGPNYARFMDAFTMKIDEGYHVTANVIEVPAEDNHADVASIITNEVLLVRKAHEFFESFKSLFADLILSFRDRDKSRSFFKECDYKNAFHLIEVELGFAYDVFYTKAPLIYTPKGCILRLISLTSTIAVFVVFTVAQQHKHNSITNLIITYVLLVGAIVLEICAITKILSSDWAKLWLRMCPSTKKQWWSKSVAQCNLVSFCLVDNQGFFYRTKKLLHLDEVLQMHWYRTCPKIFDESFQLIFNHFLNKSKYTAKDDLVPLFTCRGGLVLKKFDFQEVEWSISAEFDQSLLVWHIATDLCYYFYSDDEIFNIDFNSNLRRQESKQLSDYMLYLLVLCPSMMPNGIGHIRFRDTCSEATEFFQERSPNGTAEACEMLRQVSTRVKPIAVKGDRSKSVLFDGVRLASSLLQTKGSEERWEIISNVWVELLGYAASQCNGHSHAQQLRRGGELLTHVWLLMAHLGITEQFQIEQGHARAKLIVK